MTDAAGNTGSATHGITLSGNPPEFTPDPISRDNVLNAQEAMQPLSLSGTSNLPNGSAVTVTLNNVNYQATVENGRWSVQVPVSDVLDLANTLYTVSVSGTDSVGNSGSAEANLLVDTVLPQVIVNTFAGDKRSITPKRRLTKPSVDASPARRRAIPSQSPWAARATPRRLAAT